MKCEATIEFGDVFGDNHSAFHCQLEQGHKGPHQEKGDIGSEQYKMPYTLTWEGSCDELEATRPVYDEDEDEHGRFKEAVW